MSFWKQSLRKTDLWEKILLKLTHGKKFLWEMILGMRTLWKRKSPQQTREFDQFDAERLRDVLPLSQRNYWEIPEGYVPIVPIVNVLSTSSPDPIPADPQPESGDPQFEASDSQPEAVDLQPESADSPSEAGEREPEDPARLADEMAASFYGFGDWTAPYWFIGLEPGKAPGEEAYNSHIVHAWANGLKKGELVDCLEYHRAIGVDTWHKDRAKLQPTWRPLMLFLMTALDRDSDKEALRAYQRTRWGQMGDGETCVIELSGIRTNGHAVEADRKEHLAQRIGAIRRKIKMGDTSPKVVVLHGLSARAEWEQIAGVPLEPDTVVPVGSTLFVMTPSPTAFRRKNADWESLGLEVRERLSTG